MKQKKVKCMYCIVKRRGHEEEFDERKVYASVYAACLSAHIDHVKAEKIAEQVTKKIKIWIAERRVINSNDIFEEITKVMKTLSEEAAFMYETHRDIA